MSILDRAISREHVLHAALVLLSCELAMPVTGSDAEAELDFEQAAGEAFDDACRRYVAALVAEGGEG
jgi:hypothetical protein